MDCPFLADLVPHEGSVLLAASGWEGKESDEANIISYDLIDELTRRNGDAARSLRSILLSLRTTTELA
jgi:hypothetical protein